MSRSALTFFFLVLALQFATVRSADAGSAKAAIGTTPVRTNVPANEITVATRTVEPFVIKDGDQFTGFSIELWRAIAIELGIKSRFSTMSKLPSCWRRCGAATPGRHFRDLHHLRAAEELDFSQPMFRSGLSIMVSSENQGLNVMAA